MAAVSCCSRRRTNHAVGNTSRTSRSKTRTRTPVATCVTWSNHPRSTICRVNTVSGSVATACKPWATEEQYALLRAYLASRHPNGGMADMDEQDFADMVEQTPVDSYLIEYREPTVDGVRGRLIGCCLTDRQSDGLSMIYSFFDASHPLREGLGTYIILDHVQRAAQAGLAYVYLGYWIEGSARMAYKARFRPLEKLGPEGWSRFEPVASDRIAAQFELA